MLFRCLVCDLSIVRPRPLCAICATVLAEALKQPVIETEIALPRLKTVHARYPLTGMTYRILLGWKKRRGPLLDHAVLNLPDEFIQETRSRRIDAIIPIPQSPARAWRLQGSPAQTIALAISRATRIPIVQPLRLVPRPGPRQGQLRLEERLSRPIRFDARKDMRIKSALIVDDFITTGRTLAAAAAALHEAGVSELRGFGLGFRPRKAPAEYPEATPPA